jgi:hypothetical protein
MNTPTPPWVQIVVAALAAKRARRQDLPYRLEQTSDPDRLCVVSRGYKPVGIPWERRLDRVNYDDYPGHHVSRAHFDWLRDVGAASESGYFFADSNAPWISAAHFRDYRAKIMFLLKPWLVSTGTDDTKSSTPAAAPVGAAR